MFHVSNKLIAFIIVIIGAMSFTIVNNDKLYEISKNIEIFVKTYKELNNNYVDDLDPSQLMRTGIDAMVKSLDPYTNYISESQVESYRINNEGKYQGFGAVVKKIGDYVTIVEPYKDSPLTEAGLKAGDEIIEINGQSTKGKTTDEVTQFARGVAGTDLNLKINRPLTNETFDAVIERGKVEIPNVPYSGIIRDHIGYISLTTFTPNAGKNIAKAIKKLKREDEELAGIILDLRFNGGGLLREAINIVNLFIPKDEPAVFTRGKVKDRDVTFSTKAEPMDLDIPLAVMINKRSASASEIVSGVIQDLDRGVVIGQRSFGKGLVQNTFDLGYNSRVKITTSKYYIPSGRCIQGLRYEDGEPVDIPDSERTPFKTRNGREVLDGGGVTPDIRLEAPENPALLKALKEDNVIFKYVNKYVHNNAAPDSLTSLIKFTDYEGFKSFVANSDFTYQSETEKKIEDLKEAIEEEKMDGLNVDLSAMEAKVEAEKNTAFTRYERIIVNAIQEEIATRYYLQEGKAFQRLSDDTEVETAIDVLTDPAKYAGILSNK